MNAQAKIPYGEEEEPYWREHDGSAREAEPPQPLAFRYPHSSLDPDWDDSHWTLGEHYWLRPMHYQRNFWTSLREIFSFWRAREYTLTDEVVADEVCEALAHEPEVDVNDIEVHVDHGHVTLRGRAPDHWMRQQAEDAVYFLPGVNGVTNDIEVRVA